MLTASRVSPPPTPREPLADLAADAIEEARARFEDVADEVKGEILYLIGENNGPEAEDFLSRIASGRHAPGVREAAAKAIQTLKQRFSDLV